MSVRHAAVGWSRRILLYDGAFLAIAIGWIVAFVAATIASSPAGSVPSEPILAIRALGSAAFVLLTLLLAIGPLARLDPRAAPLLYNRRHLGVAIFTIGLLHAALATVWYHGFGDRNPIVSIFVTERAMPLDDWRAWLPPFQPLGALALACLFLLAATSHDFWLQLLGPRAWKRLHLLAYVAWFLLVAHIALGSVRANEGVARPAMLAFGVLLVGGLHVAAGVREARRTREDRGTGRDGWVEVRDHAAIAEGTAARVVLPDGSPVAVFRCEGSLRALGGTCSHQGGPIAEGRIVDGCVTCPWHGWQYDPDTGAAPPPFTERIARHPIRIEDGRVFVGVEPDGGEA